MSDLGLVLTNSLESEILLVANHAECEEWWIVKNAEICHLLEEDLLLGRARL